MNYNAIDISYVQAGIDPTIDPNIEYIVVKASQKDYKDPQFENHMRMIGNKCNVGFYHFLECHDEKEAVQQAKIFLNIIAPYSFHCSYVYLDCEVYNIQYMRNMSKEKLTSVCLAFLNECTKAGYIACLYTNIDHMENRLVKRKIEGNYPIWIANYSPCMPEYKNILMWQYGAGHVEGYSGMVDLDVHFFSKEEMAIMSLARKGFILSPVFWIKHYKKTKWLGLLLIKANSAYRFKWKESKKVEWALEKLFRDGVINSPTYWESQASKNKNIKQLLLNLGGGVR